MGPKSENVEKALVVVCFLRVKAAMGARFRRGSRLARKLLDVEKVRFLIKKRRMPPSRIVLPVNNETIMQKCKTCG